jgi:nucleoside-diphosphate-sugar epimerase
MTASAHTVAITGASGLIGRHLCDHLHRAGWRVRALARDPERTASAHPGIERFAMNLPHAIDPASVRGADVVVHAAYATRAGDRDAARLANERGTTRLLAVARDAGVRRFVFLSSLSAQTGAVSYYAASKRALEGVMDPHRDLIVRPGLVLANDGGLAQRMQVAMARTRVMPVFGDGTQIVQTVHIDDLCEAIGGALSQDLTGAFNIAEPDGVTMRELLQLLAGAAQTRAMAIRIPASAALFALRTLEAARIPMPVSSDNLLGLLAMRHVDTRTDLTRLGIALRSAAQSIADLATSVPGSS